MRGMSAPHVVMSVIAYINKHICQSVHAYKAYMHVHYDYVFIKNIYDKECLMYIKYANNNLSSRNSQYT